MTMTQQDAAAEAAPANDEAHGVVADHDASVREAHRRAIGDSVLEVDNITLRFGGVKAITDVSFNIRQHEIFAIIGPNGAGKTSMLNVINGFYHPQEGTISYKGKVRQRMRPYEVAMGGIARTFQNVALFRGMSTLDNMMAGRLTKMHGLAERTFDKSLAKVPVVNLITYPFFWAADFMMDAFYWGPYQKEEERHRKRVEEIIEFLEIQDIRRTPVGRLPYGLQKRVELGRALAMDPELLLLDEPMAGMNVEEKEDMSRFIIDVNEEFGTTMALIEHDMGVVMDISDRVVVLNYGQKLAEGTPDEVQKNQDVIDAYLGVSHD
jgi:branched-chain amino acid transport system ATP-binding protein